MNELTSLVLHTPLAEARSAFYYLGRYLKQAVHDDYQKDIFDDYPHEELAENVENVKALTKKIIEFIEKSQGKPAQNFTDKEYSEWMDKIDAAENGLDPLPSTGQIDQAEKVIKELTVPTLGGIKIR
ncbi:hypothetical protein [Pseudomonas bananamidigenes]|uniref:hypothetical protein n=1 Tax=Pseudomonas bananamidigenes TaxID=2843610 RepID=UPI00080359CD|nr:hypothetical protein [Pseudomonas bananamidigenes]